MYSIGPKLGTCQGRTQDQIWYKGFLVQMNQIYHIITEELVLPYVYFRTPHLTEWDFFHYILEEKSTMLTELIIRHQKSFHWPDFEKIGTFTRLFRTNERNCHQNFYGNFAGNCFYLNILACFNQPLLNGPSAVPDLMCMQVAYLAAVATLASD